jgi:hypothetical protein
VLTEAATMVEQMDRGSDKPPTFKSHRFEG